MGQSLLSRILFGNQDPKVVARKEAKRKEWEERNARYEEWKKTEINKKEYKKIEIFVNSFLLCVSEEIGINNIIAIKGMNGVLKIELKNNLQYEKENFTKKLQMIKEISQLSCNDKWINVAIYGLNAPNVAEEIWNRFNIHKNVKNNDLNKQIELLKHQQEILDRQIELEKIKSRNNRG